LGKHHHANPPEAVERRKFLQPLGDACILTRVKAIYMSTTSGEMFGLNLNARLHGRVRVDAAAFTTTWTNFTATPTPLTIR
jgi:hypothetical protein